MTIAERLYIAITPPFLLTLVMFKFWRMDRLARRRRAQ